MANPKHQMNSQDMLMIHDLASQVNVNNPNYAANLANGLGEQEGISIYIRAVSKIIESHEKIKLDVEEEKNLKRYRKANEAAQKNADVTNEILYSQKVIGEFVKGFSVVHDEAAKDFMILFLKRFVFLDENLQLFMVTKEKRYLDDNFLMLSRIKQTFEKIMEISKSPKEEKAEAPSEVDNSEVSV